ncbi:bifunctional lysylphosphatidylglycerol flippase/synthetase MprF [Novispirillum itersonii]|uniref:Phosphatidylglycerol lysyltransferase n=1 Tax=Novispirillum itersonii TaxID=189 RepID=A0A7W9ZDL8_NOVIT|nr:bifunctional lysylphosphatidylglycerol flippase/synthetase MprF [Novispirillum itersonii]MBB6209248.1 phosphatidylglycerol lysyltransferase [Novispirillum itersonii]
MSSEERADRPVVRPAVSNWLTSVRPMMTVAVVAVVLVLAWMAASRLTAEVSYEDLMRTVRETPHWALISALGLTLLSFAALAVYDFGALAYIGRTVPASVVGLTSFCAYAVGNTAGFGPLTAGAIRYRFYTPYGIETEDVARIVAFVSVAFGIGLAGVTGFGLLVASVNVSTLPMSPLGMKIVGGGLVIGLFVLWAMAGQGRIVTVFARPFALPSRAILIRQFFATAIDIIASAAVLWVLLPAGSIDLPSFIAVYSVAIGLGVLSHVPAGLGVFETVVIASLGPHIDVRNVLGALVLYRVIYHLLPLMLAAAFIAALELRRAASSPMVTVAAQAGARLAPPVLAGLTLVTGGVMILSGTMPLDDAVVTLLDGKVPLPLVEGGHFLGSVLGVVLLAVARGLVHRLDGAWWAAVLVVCTDLLLSLIRALAIEELLLSGFLLLVLLATRKEFPRKASLLHQTLTPQWFLAMVTLLVTTVTLLFFVYKDVEYANQLWWQFELSQHAPRSLRAVMGVVLASCFGAVWMLMRPARATLTAPTAEDLIRAMEIVAQQPAPEACLVAMRDKSLLFSDDGRAFIMYSRQGRSWVALGDPVGPRDCWPDLIWRFVEMVLAGGGRPVFYQVTAEALSYYADAGLRGFKLGEEARVRLPDFSLKGSKRNNLRNSLNRSEREGITFEVLDREQVAAQMDELESVSRIWMNHHSVREKRFSLGAFDRDYVLTQPIAVLRQEGRIIAFASVIRTECRETAGIDLMRFLPDTPHGVMEVLILRLILHFQGEGFQWFTLGMAPLSGLSDSEAAPIWHSVGRTVFEHGEWFYNFSGLRAFKAKFFPEWRSRYLAVRGGINPMIALTDITVLISGGFKGVIGK